MSDAPRPPSAADDFDADNPAHRFGVRHLAITMAKLRDDDSVKGLIARRLAVAYLALDRRCPLADFPPVDDPEDTPP
jgi:hypothetical protein